MIESIDFIEESYRCLEIGKLFLPDKKTKSRKCTIYGYVGIPHSTYCAMFYAAAAALIRIKQLPLFSSLSNKRVISAFNKHFVKTGIFPKELSLDLHNAFENTHKEGFEWKSYSIDDVEHLMQRGKDFVDIVARWLEKLPR